MARPALTKALAEQAVKTVEKAHKRAQAQNRSSVALAAEMLGISRSTMWNRIHSAAFTYGLKPEIPLAVELSVPEQTESPYIGYEIDHPQLPPSYLADGHVVELTSRADNTFLFGAAGDLHAASKYCRWDVREDLYKTFIEEGAQCNFDTGNWIDGEMKFNRYDLDAHGLDQQCELLAQNHPRGLKTYAVWGDDHEGWYAQREGINAGQYCASIMQAGGHDWVDLGYLEAHVALRNANSGKIATLAVVHPGGGSSYATSYAIQKIIECVPLSAEILTLDGWRKHDEIAVGSMVLGYNAQTDKCEWTTVTAINRGWGELIKFSNDQFSVECTEDHKWAIEWESRAGPNKNSRIPKHYSRRDRLIQAIDQTRIRSRIIQAAMAPDGPGMAHLGPKEWLRRDNAVATVMSLTSGERRSFIEAMMLGEGTVSGKEQGRTLLFSQRPGPVADAFRLACFLEGIATTEKRRPPGSFKPNGNPTLVITMLQKRMRICDKLKRENSGLAQVWCPTTGLGTWVMRYGSTITITGNSLEGGEKPNVALYGHYHKLWAGIIRNVFTCQTGCQQDQTPFLRKKRIEAHVGGCLIKLRQDPKTGAIISMQPEMIRYFNKSFHLGSGRWSRHGPIVKIPRK